MIDDLANMEHHPVASIFPMLDGPAYEALRDDIAERGCIEPLIVVDGLLLDGRNRLRACIETGQTPGVDFFTGDDPVAEVISRNIHRRHLNESQRAMAAARLATLRDGERANGERLTQAQAADMLNVGERSIRRARAVLGSGAPELIEAVDGGAVSVSRAAEVLKGASVDEQRAAVEALDPAVVAKVAKERRETRKQELADRKRERAEAQASHARSALPTVSGVEIRHADVFDVLEVVTGAALIHMDFPWEYGNQGNGGATGTYSGNVLGVADATRAIDLAAESAGPDAVLLCWVTMPFLWPLIRAMEPGGWQYQTAGVWGKTGRIGIGHYWRGQAEALLLFTRGRPVPLTTIRNLHLSERTEHSEKPVAWLRDLVQCFTPEGGLVLDLFAGLAPMARACAAEGRRYIGAELDDDRHAEACRRLADFDAEIPE